ncbi:MAG: flavin monoamine oxidase family protein [Yoonia sp.]|uniref:flavin monoamine oxidase family protein n=1 Tax=Yoonia sp. TaxID=2212373 RepID=UPI003EF7A866
MKTKTLIIGGGLSGLSLAHALQQAGHDYQLIEARDRLGGRIKSLTVGNSHFDLGPSWIWPGQERVAKLLKDLGLVTFAQWDRGAQLFEQPDGTVLHNSGFMSMAGSYRIAGGTSALTGALAAGLDPARVHLGAAAQRISADPFGAFAGDTFVAAEKIVLAVPPRLAAQLEFQPALPEPATDGLQGLPTWMAAHAKFVAVYPTPFWRDNGLSGDASSRHGPMAEIHDASPDDASFGALFGFMGVPAAQRARAGQALADAAVAQLVRLFGDAAGTPLATHLQDWSRAPFTATAADASPPPGHPAYQMPQALRQVWDDRLIFAVTELAPDNGGLIEGALAASEAAARAILA